MNSAEKIKYILYSWNLGRCPYCGGEVDVNVCCCFDCDKETEYSDYIDEILQFFPASRKEQRDYLIENKERYFKERGVGRKWGM